MASRGGCFSARPTCLHRAHRVDYGGCRGRYGCDRRDDPAKDVAQSADLVVGCHRLKSSRLAPADRSVETEWVLLTSGTTGRPKMAVHTLSSLIGPLDRRLAAGKRADLEHVLRHSSLWRLADPAARTRRRRLDGLVQRRRTGRGLSRPRRRSTRVTHISGTPSHWRRALMSGATARMPPDYVRLSGEACDQAILDNLRHAYPGANIAHAFASTEAGVAFDVRDGGRLSRHR